MVSWYVVNRSFSVSKNDLPSLPSRPQLEVVPTGVHPEAAIRRGERDNGGVELILGSLGQQDEWCLPQTRGLIQSGHQNGLHDRAAAHPRPLRRCPCVLGFASVCASAKCPLDRCRVRGDLEIGPVSQSGDLEAGPVALQPR
jgi:hypothetical protein